MASCMCDKNLSLCGDALVMPEVIVDTEGCPNIDVIENF